MRYNFELYSFYSDAESMKQCIKAGVDGIVVDWEVADKRHRQSLFNTQINRHDLSTLKSAASTYHGTIICRVNGGDLISQNEISSAITHGATDILVPMVKNLSQIEQVLRYINGQARCLIMIETIEAIKISAQIGSLPIDGVYVGLNDLAIARNSRNIFVPIVDGTLDEIKSNIPMRLGVAGLTHPAFGSPIPSHLLVNELRRLECDFTFLRRSFYRDASQLGIASTISAIRRSLEEHTQFDKTKSEIFKKLVSEIVTPMI
ncbi:aldolase/citrate lyase family protein [Roseivirga sp.]|uniref:aldolase/citrate lyase family protein n=1 Tax=Roseivirga sp. TaxID=1964215 RepID=UPI003B8BAE79